MKPSFTEIIIGVAKFSVNPVSLTKYQEKHGIGNGDENKTSHIIKGMA